MELNTARINRSMILYLKIKIVKLVQIQSEEGSSTCSALSIHKMCSIVTVVRKVMIWYFVTVASSGTIPAARTTREIRRKESRSSSVHSV